MVKKPQIFLQLFLVIFVGVYTFSLFTYPAFSNEVDDLQQQIDQKNQELVQKQTTLSSIEAKIKEISGSNNSVSQKITLINAEITKLNDSIAQTEGALNAKMKEITDKQTLLETKKIEMDNLSSDLYMQSRYRLSTFFLSGDSWDTLVKDFFLKKSTISMLKNDMEQINGEFSSLAESKAELEKQKTDLDVQKKDMDDSYALLAAEKAKLQKELNSQTVAKSSITSQINQLTSQLSNLQRTLLSIRQGGTYVNVDSVPNGGDYLGSLKGFVEKANSGSFGIFSIGAYTNRVGMSQWGAKARAEEGQTYSKILEAYYPGYTLQRQEVPSEIKVKFCGKVDGVTKCNECPGEYTKSYKFEDEYMKGIYEISESWPYETIKAQVIAARTFALRVTSNGVNSIRADECGQVFKPQPKTGAWAQAVVETQRGNNVLKDASGNYATGMFAAITGGWVKRSTSDSNGWWDTTDGTGNGDWMSRAWDTRSKTGLEGTYYWFYKSWYRQGYSVGASVDAGSCYRNPWLSPQELADIVNTASYLNNLGATGRTDDRVYPIHDRCHSDGNPYSFSEMSNKSSTKFTKIIDAYVNSSNGTTNSIKFINEDGREVSIPGNYFKLGYNLRAPGYLSIPQGSFLSGFVHIDIQKK